MNKSSPLKPQQYPPAASSADHDELSITQPKAVEPKTFSWANWTPATQKRHVKLHFIKIKPSMVSARSGGKLTHVMIPLQDSHTGSPMSVQECFPWHTEEPEHWYRKVEKSRRTPSMVFDGQLVALEDAFVRFEQDGGFQSYII